MIALKRYTIDLTLCVPQPCGKHLQCGSEHMDDQFQEVKASDLLLH